MVLPSNIRLRQANLRDTGGGPMKSLDTSNYVPRVGKSLHSFLLIPRTGPTKNCGCKTNLN